MATQKILLCVLCLIYPSLTRSQENYPEPIVTIEQGQLRGVFGTNLDGEVFYSFFGIPYAKSPVENLRFQPPQQPDSWSGIRNASKPGDTCISIDDFTSEVVGSEDCLYLNVYTRNLSNPGKSLKPVMVYIYGGGLTYGSSRAERYGPDFFMLEDIVLVTINYRLGMLGFLCSDDPDLGVPGNMGLKDQLMALKWVQANIKNFNGDPSDVTVFGNSAGAASIHAHILSPSSKGLFHKAILQSGSALNSWFWGAKNNAREIVSKAGKTASTEKEALEILKSLNYTEIFSAQLNIPDPHLPAEHRPFSAVIEIPNDTEFLTKNPVDIIKEGNYNQVPIIIGYTNKEAMILDSENGIASRIGTELPEDEFPKILPNNVNVTENSSDYKEILATLRNLYSGKPTEERYDVLTDSYLVVPVIESLRSHLKNALNPIYLYRFSLAGQLNREKRLLNFMNESGACHEDELGYQFTSDITTPITRGSLEDRSVRALVKLWTNFAIHGNPTPDKSLNVTWEPVQSIDQIRLLDIKETIQMNDFPERQRLEVWWSIFEKWPLDRY